MHSVDTNVVVRLLTRDDERQFRKAKSIFGRSNIWIAKTVLLETEWVLRSKYAYTPEALLNALTGLVALEHVSVEDETTVQRALELFSEGFDFADALHFASVPQGTIFLTFDEALVHKAKRLGLKGIAEA